MDGCESQKIAPAFSAYNPSLDIKNRPEAVACADGPSGLVLRLD